MLQRFDLIQWNRVGLTFLFILRSTAFQSIDNTISPPPSASGIWADKDSIFLMNAKYYNTQGTLLLSYFEHPIYLAPLETVEIVIDEGDREGGTGANFCLIGA